MKKTLDNLLPEHGREIAKMFDCTKYRLDDGFFQVIRDDNSVKEHFILTYPARLPSAIVDYLRSVGYDIPNAYPSQPERVEGGEEPIPWADVIEKIKDVGLHVQRTMDRNFTQDEIWKHIKEQGKYYSVIKKPADQDSPEAKPCTDEKLIFQPGNYVKYYKSGKVILISEDNRDNSNFSGTVVIGDEAHKTGFFSRIWVRDYNVFQPVKISLTPAAPSAVDWSEVRKGIFRYAEAKHSILLDRQSVNITLEYLQANYTLTAKD